MSITSPTPSKRPGRPLVALLGNPNTGKTTLFNALTGLRHKVSNYPGCTVERKLGSASIGAGAIIDLVDLPGTYSLAARSPDELIAVDVLLGQRDGEAPIDAAIAIIDAANLERNLYLVSQLLETGLPTVVVLNMSDLAVARGIEIDATALSRRLGVPVVPTRADKGLGLDELRAALAVVLAEPAREPLNAARNRWAVPFRLPESLESGALELVEELERQGVLLGRDVPRVEALRALVDGGGAAERRLVEKLGPGFETKIAEIREKAGAGHRLTAVETRARYGWVRQVVEGCVDRPETPVRTVSDRLDSVLTHWLSGSLVLLAVLTIVFQAIYRWSAPLMDGIQLGFDGLGAIAGATLPAGPLQSLVVDGVIGGAGSVVVFLPQILTLFLFIALLEDCGYMARAAFLMDKLFVKFGLSGKSMIPLLSSFACAVPGIMAARTIESRRNRLATMIVAPLMSCSARLPVYVLLIGAFVPQRSLLGGILGLQGLTLLAAHLLGIFVAIPVLWILRKTFLRGPAPPFMMELPAYRIPHWRQVVSRLLDQGRAFLARAGTIIFAASIVVWALAYFPHPDQIHGEYESLRAGATSAAEIERLNREEAGTYLRQSLIGRVGQASEPIVRPLGWDWRIGMAVAASFPAREVVIATMGTIFNLGADVDETSSDLAAVLRDAKRSDGGPLFNLPVACSLIVFFALCCQCASTLAVMKRETGSWKWVVFTFTYMTLLAYTAAFVAYRALMALGLGDL